MARGWAGAMAEAEAEPGPTGAAAAEASMVRVGGWLAAGVPKYRAFCTDQGWVGEEASGEVWNAKSCSPWETASWLLQEQAFQR